MSRSKTLRPAIDVAALLAVAALLGGCFLPYSKQALPMRLYTRDQAQNLGLRLGDRVERTHTGLRLFTWPVDLPSAVDAIEEMIVAYQALGIANLEVNFHEWSILYIVSYPKVTVAGRLVLPPLAPGREAARAPAGGG